eukprot:1195553-Prorocentrum_minimum.AAC.2
MRWLNKVLTTVNSTVPVLSCRALVRRISCFGLACHENIPVLPVSDWPESPDGGTGGGGCLVTELRGVDGRLSGQSDAGSQGIFS